MHPKYLRFSPVTKVFLLLALPIVLLSVVSVKPLWQWGWRVPVYAYAQFGTVTSAQGKKFPSGAWTQGRRLLVYGAPKVDAKSVALAADGLRSMVRELGLKLSVEELAVPPKGAAAALQVATAASRGLSFDFDAFEQRRLDDRGMQYAEMVVVPAQFKDPSWAWGLTNYPAGLSVLQQGETSRDLGRHEGTHLLGYDKHDDMPLYVFGYREGWVPAERNTLMMLLPKTSDALSDRAHDALLNFWRGKEAREHEKYLE